MKKCLSIALTVLIIITALPLTAITSFAATSGDFEYSVISEEDKTCEITRYSGSATNLAIPSTLDGYNVISIGSQAFYGRTSLVNLTIPDSVTSIGYCAFGNCTSLASINVSTGNTVYSSVDGVLFNKDKTELIQYPVGNARTTYIIPDSVTTIGHDAFRGCTSLTSITIPNSVTSIGALAFYNCTSLESVTIGNSVTSIGKLTFYNTAYYNNATNWENDVLYIGNHLIEAKDTISGDYAVKDGTKTIAGGAFEDCTSLASITIPDSVTSIGYGAFSYCTSLESINVSNDNTAYSYVDGVLFNKAQTELIQYPVGNARTTYIILDSVTTIGHEAFRGCTSLTSITLPVSVTQIGEASFEDCTSLTDVYYTSTESWWNEISISIGNQCLTSATIHYDDNNNVENPIMSISAVSNRTYVENYDGYYTTDYIYDENGCYTGESEKYFYYGVWDSDFDYVVTLKDGSTIEGDAGDICDAIGYWPQIETNQSYDNQWSLGTHEVEISLIGVTTTAEVEVVENPIESISAVSNRTYIENYDGYYETDYYYDDSENYIETEEYFYYSVWDSDFDYVVTLKDGSIIEGTAWDIDEAIGYWPQIETNQSYENQWGVGTHEVEISLLGVTTSAEIEILSSPKLLNGWVQEDSKWAYYENGVKVTNRWVKDSQGWCYLGDDGYCVTNQWKADSKGWCYLDSNGRMVINNWVNDNGKWYFLDANGYMVSNCWKKDSNGWCYLGSSGAMLTNAWVKDSQGWCYVGADGYCVTNKWVKDSHGWCYLDSNGRMATNKWIKDSVGWCYVGADGYCVTNQWKADSKGWCYLDGNGRMMTNSWLQWNGNWYYLDENGYMVTGTKVINGKTYKFASNGVWIG